MRPGERRFLGHSALYSESLDTSRDVLYIRLMTSETPNRKTIAADNARRRAAVLSLLAHPENGKPFAAMRKYHRLLGDLIATHGKDATLVEVAAALQQTMNTMLFMHAGEGAVIR